MNHLIKYLFLPALFVLILSSASAVFDMNAVDANHVRHANKGEDFNVMIFGGGSADVNSDYNYMVALRYQSTYVDLNIIGWKDDSSGNTAGTYNPGGDGNVVSRKLIAAGSGPCANAIDVNVLALPRTRGGVALVDFNFNITVTIPSTGSAINHLVGKEISVELWPLIDQDASGTITTASCGEAADANARFVIGPAIIVTTPNATNLVGKIDQNINIIGLGFTPGFLGTGAQNVFFPDSNVSISIRDANSSVLSSPTNGDLNMRLVNHGRLAMYHWSTLDADTNCAVRSWGGMPVANDLNAWTWDGNGVWVFPDANGEFDVNIRLPYLSNQAGSSIGRDLNIIRAISTAGQDANAIGFIVAPKITEPEDINATITVSGNTYSITDAFMKRLVTNLQSVSDFIVRLGGLVDGMGNRQIVVKFNNDVNFTKTPIANYGTDMNGRPGYVSIDSTSLPEFAIDANVFMYNVKSPSSMMPLLTRDGQPCPTTICMNLDGTTLSEDGTGVFGTKTWSYNPATGDGNLAFRVSTFSAYETTGMAVELQYPEAYADIRKPRHGIDGNYTVQFRFKDQNIQDNDINKNGATPMRALIYYSTSAGAKTGTLINDTNLFDMIGVRCNGWNTFGYFGGTPSSDVNMQNWITCVYDINRTDLNRLHGEFIIDVNVTGPTHANGIETEKSALDSTDANIFFNRPVIEITDANFSTQNFAISYHSDSQKYQVNSMDINYVIDFNIYIPDINWGADQNMRLSDFNFHFYLSNRQGGTTDDLNIDSLGFDQNFTNQLNRKWIAIGASGYMECTAPPAETPYMDYNCIAQFDTNNVIEGKHYLTAKMFNRNRWSFGLPNAGDWVAETIDVNELWDVNSTVYNFSINDNNAPRINTAANTTTTVTGSSYAWTLQCDDNTSGAAEYFFRIGAENWMSNGTSPTYTFSVSGNSVVTRTFHGGCRDYANNISDINATATVTFKPGGGGGDTSGGTVSPGGPSGGAPAAPVEGIEVIYSETFSNKPTADEIRKILTEVGASENAIAKASAAVSKTMVTRTVEGQRITDANGLVTYRTVMTITVVNPGSKKLGMVKIIEEIPKNIAASASLITSLHEFKVLKADPIIEFTIDSLLPKKSTEIIYVVNGKIGETMVEAWKTVPVTADLSEEEPCEGVVCPAETCKTGACNTGTEICEYTNKADGTSCGTNMECKAGACVEKAVPYVPPAAPPAQDNTLLIVLAVIAIVAIGAGAYLFTAKKKKGKR